MTFCTFQLYACVVSPPAQGGGHEDDSWKLRWKRHRSLKCCRTCVPGSSGFIAMTDCQTPEFSQVLLGRRTKRLSGITFQRVEGRSL